MNNLTRIEVFNKVKGHLLSQGQRAVVCEGEDDGRAATCRYRTSKGLKCAAGCLILDEHYFEDLEGSNISDSKVQEALKASGVDIIADLMMFELVEELQRMHDISNSHYKLGPDTWPTRLASIHKEFFGEAK